LRHGRHQTVADFLIEVALLLSIGRLKGGLGKALTASAATEALYSLSVRCPVIESVSDDVSALRSSSKIRSTFRTCSMHMGGGKSKRLANLGAD
jgi:hypothetical protein